jgi:hypothetical protein
MKILENKITNFSSANFTEDETIWLVSNTYQYGQEIRYGHFIYKYAGDNNTNTTDNPEVDSKALTPKWVNVAPSNYYAMFDNETSTQTEVVDKIEFEIQVSNYDAISLLNIEGSSVLLTIVDNVSMSEVYLREIDLFDTSAIVDFYSYCFNEIQQVPSIYIDDLPLYTNATLKVVINNIGSVAKCGRLVCGRTYYIGTTGYGVNLNQESYSKKDTDIFGNTTLIHSNSVNLDSYEVHIPTLAVPNIRRKFRELDAVAILFVMDDSENSVLDNLLTFGYYQSFSILIPDSQISTASLQIKGLI